MHPLAEDTITRWDGVFSGCESFLSEKWGQPGLYPECDLRGLRVGGQGREERQKGSMSSSETIVK